MKKISLTAAVFCFLINVYSDSIKSFDNEQDWMAYIAENTPKEYSEMINPTRKEAKERFKTEEDLKKHMEKWGSRGRFFIPLKVINETGTAIPNISVVVTKGIGGFFKTTYKDFCSDHQHGFLVIEADGCETVTVRLFPENCYCPAEKKIIYYLNIPENYSIKKGDTILGLPIPIGFRKSRELLKLQRTSDIEFTINEKTNMSNFFSLHSLKMEDEMKDDSGPYFTVLYKRDANGEILQKQYPSMIYNYILDSNGICMRSLETRDGPSCQFTGFEQAEFVLISKDPEDGVILYDYKTVPVIPTEPVAPLDGYKKGFVMPFSSTAARYRFFFRFGGRYGKGIISYNLHGDHCIEELYINNETDPEKKRNLWTR